MQPAEVRRRILDEHRKLRAMLDALVPLATRFERGELGGREPGCARRRWRSTRSSRRICSTRRVRSSRRCGRAGPRERSSPSGSRTSTASNGRCSPIWCRASRSSPLPTLLVAREVRSFAEYLHGTTWRTRSRRCSRRRRCPTSPEPQPPTARSAILRRFSASPTTTTRSPARSALLAARLEARGLARRA